MPRPNDPRGPNSSKYIVKAGGPAPFTDASRVRDGFHSSDMPISCSGIMVPHPEPAHMSRWRSTIHALRDRDSSDLDPISCSGMFTHAMRVCDSSDLDPISCSGMFTDTKPVNMSRGHSTLLHVHPR